MVVGADKVPTWNGVVSIKFDYETNETGAPGLVEKVIARRESLWLEQRGNLDLSVDKGVEIAAVVFDSLAMTR